MFKLLRRKKSNKAKDGSIKKTGVSNVPGIPPPPSFSSSNKPMAPILRDLKKMDINKLPRDKKAAEELDAALTEANRKLFTNNDKDDRISLYSDLVFLMFF
jgi:hypothetical protein